MGWDGMLYPENAPYNKGAFKIQIIFPDVYPWRPPKITFKTKIYHPNIDEMGQVWLSIIRQENWKPSTTAEQVIMSLVALLDSPDLAHPLRADLADEYAKDKNTFTNNA